jgi:GrpB-like predicted nucleotidyltransferase (UPF0157 family)
MVLEIVPYQERWPGEFQEIAGDLREGLGDLALRIDHIGSTSVRGLAAKDVIDIQISVRALDEILKKALVSIGYTKAQGLWRDHCPASVVAPKSAWEKWYFKPPAGQRRTHVHVRVQGRANQRYPLLFRDYLRTHPGPAGAYAELKRRLAENLADPGTYSDVKDPAVDLIYFAAEEWAETVGWAPGESDV